MLVTVIAALAALVSALGPPQEDARLADQLMNVSHAFVAELAGCDATDGYEPFASGLWIGATADCADLSAGYWIADDGSVVFEVSEP